MSFTVLRPSYLLLIPLGAGLLGAMWWRWPPPLSPGRSRVALVLRVLLLTVLVLSLAGVRMSRTPDRRALVAVVDLSDSTRSGTDAAATAVRDLLAAKGPDDLFGVVSFGRNAQVELPPSLRPTFDGFQTRPDGSFSDLGGALELAANLIPDGYARQIVLISDGRQNLGDAGQAIRSLRGRSIRVDVVPLGTPPSAEIQVLTVEAPSDLRVGESLSVIARLRSTGPASGSLSFEVDGRQIEDRTIDLPSGLSEQAITVPPLEPGIHRLAVVLNAEPDGYAQNNRAEAVVRVVGAPVVLVLEGAPGAGANMGAALTAAGMRVDTRRAEDAPADVGSFAGYDATVLADVAASAFPPGAMRSIAASVRDLGRGLVAVGGTRSYGPGDWGGTPLEDALPVRMEAPQPKKRPAVAVVIVVETMESEGGDQVALGALESLIDGLTPDDEFALVVMRNPGDNNGSVVAVPLTNVVDKPGLKGTIRNLQLGDPPGYAQSISLGLGALGLSTAANKHLVLIGDGDATADLGGYDQLMVGASSQGVIVSALGVNTHSDETFMAHMRSIAQLGGGRYFQSDTTGDVPQILLDSTRSTLRPWFEQSPFSPIVTSAGGLLEGVPLTGFPELGGYVVTTPKPTADVVLSSPSRDPVLVGGQYGLGRSVAWTSDSLGRWTAGFLGSPVSATLFGRMVAWALPTGGGELRLDATPSGDGLDVTVTGPPDGGDLEVRSVSPAGASASHRLRPVAPGQWQGLVPAGEVGTYLLHAVLQRAGAALQVEVSVPVPYSPEYLELGRDDGFLRTLAKVSGTVLTRTEAAWSQPRLPVAFSNPVSWLLIFVGLVLWPLDIGLRRMTVTLAQMLAATREWWRDRRAPQERSESTESPDGRQGLKESEGPRESEDTEGRRVPLVP